MLSIVILSPSECPILRWRRPSGIRAILASASAWIHPSPPPILPEDSSPRYTPHHSLIIIYEWSLVLSTSSEWGGRGVEVVGA